MDIKLTKKLPTEAGQYLIKWKMGQRFELITVVHIPARSLYGVEWDEYLAIVEWRNRNIMHINMSMVVGISEKLEEFTCQNDKKEYNVT